MKAKTNIYLIYTSTPTCDRGKQNKKRKAN